MLIFFNAFMSWLCVWIQAGDDHRWLHAITDVLYTVKFKVAAAETLWKKFFVNVFIIFNQNKCLFYRAGPQISKVSTPSASSPAASTTGPIRDHWLHPHYMRVSSGLSWRSQSLCLTNRCCSCARTHSHSNRTGYGIVSVGILKLYV